jgi:hypothetical protein
MEICPEGGQGSSRTVAPQGTGTGTGTSLGVFFKF